MLGRMLLAWSLLWAASAATASDRLKVGQPAPPFQLTLIDGSKVSLDQMRGEVVVLNFWATWCGPCKTELPLLDGYYRIQQKHGLRVFAITTEDSLPLGRLRKLFEVMTIPSARSVKGPYGVIGGGVPTNIVIGRDGRVRYAASGAFTVDKMNEILVPLLKEPRPAP